MVLEVLVDFSEYDDFALLFARLILGAVFIYYGFPKIKNLRTNAINFNKMGFSPGIFWGSVVAFVEFFGAIFILIGLYTDIAAALIGFNMILWTFWKIAKTDKNFSDWSYGLLVLSIVFLLLVLGAGKFVLF